VSFKFTLLQLREVVNPSPLSVQMHGAMADAGGQVIGPTVPQVLKNVLGSISSNRVPSAHRPLPTTFNRLGLSRINHDKWHGSVLQSMASLNTFLD
jgi:hypothetical protein